MSELTAARIPPPKVGWNGYLRALSMARPSKKSNPKKNKKPSVRRAASTASRGASQRRAAPRGRRRGLWRTAANSDRHELYEIAVQEVVSECDFIDRVWRSLRGRVAATLREDFCGTAKACTEWARRRKTNRAIGVDFNDAVIRWGEARHRANLREDVASRITILNADVLEVETPRIECVVAMNFSYFIFKDRATLVRYFRCVYESLSEDGIFIADAYGGSQAHEEQEEERHLDGFTYVWDQNQYNPITGDVVNHIHFRFPDGSEMKRAFTYRWRLWSLPEIQDAMREAGFQRTTVYWEGTNEKTGEGNSVFRPSQQGEACQGWIAYIAAEKRAATQRPAKRTRATK
jgi:SAM-dependent methyltransferase